MVKKRSNFRWKKVENIGQKIGIMKLDAQNSDYNNVTKALEKVLDNIDEFSDIFKTTVMENKTTAADATVAKSKLLKIEANNSGTEAEVVSILFNQDAKLDQAGNGLLKDIKLSDVQVLNKTK